MSDFDEGATGSNSIGIPDSLGVIEQLGCSDLCDLTVIDTNNPLQGIQCELQTVVQIRCFGNMNWSCGRQVKQSSVLVEDEVLLGPGEEELDRDEHREALVSFESCCCLFHCILESSSERDQVGLADIDHFELFVVCPCCCKGSILRTWCSLNSALEHGGMRTHCELHTGVLVERKVGGFVCSTASRRGHDCCHCGEKRQRG